MRIVVACLLLLPVLLAPPAHAGLYPICPPTITTDEGQELVPEQIPCIQIAGVGDCAAIEIPSRVLDVEVLA